MTAVLITGANRGLGFEFARQYLADGWHVFAACRNPATTSELERLGRGGHFVLGGVDMFEVFRWRIVDRRRRVCTAQCANGYKDGAYGSTVAWARPGCVNVPAAVAN